MERRLPLVIAAFCVLLGIGLWIYRAQGTAAATGGPLPPGPLVVRNAWTQGRRVPLEGQQQITMPDPREGGKIVTVRAAVLQSKDGKVRIEYLSEPLEGTRIWENGERTYRYNPRRNRLTIARKRDMNEEAERELELIEKNYTARVVDRDRLADRPVWVVELKSRHQLDRWKRLNVDQETWTVLESEDLEGDRGLLRRTRFTEVRYLDPNQTLPNDQFHPPAALLARGKGDPDGSARFTDLAALSRLVEFKVRAPKELPKGFVFEGAFQVPCICGRDHRAVRMVYTDGLNHITLFEAGHPECLAPKDRFKGGKPMAANLTRNGVFYWAFGPLSSRELTGMLESAASAAN